MKSILDSNSKLGIVSNQSAWFYRSVRFIKVKKNIILNVSKLYQTTKCDGEFESVKKNSEKKRHVLLPGFKIRTQQPLRAQCCHA